MTSDDQIKDGNLEYDVNREATKTSALSSGKTIQVKKYCLLSRNK